MRLLIAEDDKALGMFLSRGLEADGHRVRVACDGGSAVTAFREDLPDLTILDLNLPVKDGEQVLEEVRQVDADLPILVLTARQEVETRVRCLDHGADDLMTKPFSLHELRARCRALLRRKREARLLLRAGDLELDRMDHTARRGGRTNRAHQQGICAAGAPDDEPRPVGFSRGIAGNSVETGAGTDHQHRGCLCELSSPQIEGSHPGSSDPHGARQGIHRSRRSANWRPKSIPR